MIEPTDKNRIDAEAVVQQHERRGDSASVSTPEHAGFSKLSKNITGWTSNLLATAVVVVIALTFGSQLVSFWSPADSDSTSTEFAIGESWPALEACSLEFGDSPFQLNRESFQGNEAELISLMRARCRSAMEAGARPVAQIGKQEARMIASLASLSPVEQVDGKWRIYVGPKLDGETALPLVLGIRDDCESGAEDSDSRLVVWALGMPANENQWTTFLAQASTLDSNLGIAELLPRDAKRTMAMTDPNGGSMIGFSGGEISAAIAYYTKVAKDRNWKLDSDGNQPLESWSARFSSTEKSGFAGVHVQLSLDHTGSLKGILMVQSNNTKQKSK